MGRSAARIFSPTLPSSLPTIVKPIPARKPKNNQNVGAVPRTTGGIFHQSIVELVDEEPVAITYPIRNSSMRNSAGPRLATKSAIRRQMMRAPKAHMGAMGIGLLEDCVRLYSEGTLYTEHIVKRRHVVIRNMRIFSRGTTKVMRPACFANR